jgi:hypothetical protein
MNAARVARRRPAGKKIGELNRQIKSIRLTKSPDAPTVPRVLAPDIKPMNQPRCAATLTWSRGASRRHFLACGAAAVVTALAWPPGVFAGPRRLVMQELSLDDLRLATFAGQLHTTFRVTDAPVGNLELKLIEASLTEAAPRPMANAPDAHYEKFTLIFSGPKLPLLAQQIYRFEHPQIGGFAMFIVPILTRQPSEQRYQAVFNRPVPRDITSNT